MLNETIDTSVFLRIENIERIGVIQRINNTDFLRQRAVFRVLV